MQKLRDFGLPMVAMVSVIPGLLAVTVDDAGGGTSDGRVFVPEGAHGFVCFHGQSGNRQKLFGTKMTAVPFPYRPNGKYHTTSFSAIRKLA